MSLQPAESSTSQFRPTSIITSEGARFETDFVIRKRGAAVPIFTCAFSDEMELAGHADSS